jgi:hypothetical protein
MEAGGNAETSCVVADANNDGIPDLFVGTFVSFEVILLLGDGNGGLTFSDRTNVGGRAWMLAVGDVNLDGNVDVVSANSFANTFSVVLGGRLWENDGSGQFGNVRGFLASAAGSCAIMHDRDNDGDLDISAIDEVDDILFLFDNDPVATGAEPTPLHGRVRFLPNEPNPFNPTTTLRFNLPVSSHVTITIYTIMGEKVSTVLSERRAAGPNHVAWNAAGLPSGVYVARLQAGTVVETRKLVLAK